MNIPIICILISQAWLMVGHLSGQSTALRSLPWLLIGLVMIYMEYHDNKVKMKENKEFLEFLGKSGETIDKMKKDNN